MRPAVDREPGEHHDRNTVRHVASNAASTKLMGDSTCPHGVITANATVLIGDDKCAARAAELVDQSSAL